MLFDIDKNKGLALLQLTMALLALTVPSFLELLPVNTGIYIMFLLLAVLVVLRIKTTGKISVSVYHLAFGVILAYSLLSSIWVNNREGHLMYIFTLACAMALFSCVAEYLSGNSLESIKRRLMYLFSISGTVCAILNIGYWIIYIVPVAGKENFCRGIGNSDFLGIFMFLSALCSVALMKNNSKLRKRLLLLFVLVMIFVFVMTKSIAAWVFAVLLTSAVVIGRKTKKSAVACGIGISAVFAAIVVMILATTIYGSIFKDVFFYGIKSFFGHGGGFWSGKELFATQSYPDGAGVGLFAYMTAASGFLGLLAAVLIVLRNIMLFCKLKSTESLTALLLTICVMLLPDARNFHVILLWLALVSYNEYASNVLFKVSVKKTVNAKIGYAFAFLSVITCMLLIQTFIRVAADRAYKAENYSEAYGLYKTAAIINFTDSRSCRMAAVSLRKNNNLTNVRDEAIQLIDVAVKRDADNVDNLVEKARIYYSCGEYEMCAQQYRLAGKRAIVNDSYNLSLAKVLYQIARKYPSGSSESKRAYEEILEISQSTESLDYKKEINDIADKSLIFTKGELGVER